MLFKKNKLSEEQLGRFHTLGESASRYLRSSRKARKCYVKAYRFGNKHPSLVVGCALFLALLSTGISFYNFNSLASSKTPVTDESIPLELGEIRRLDDSIRLVEEGIEKVFIDAKAIGDSITQILQKEHLTREDSLYVVKKGKYLKEITNIIQKEP